MAKRAVWLDCDPGHDDAMAIILAGYSPHIDLLGISTVGGNQSLDKTTYNALQVVHAAGLSVDVVAGQPYPLMAPDLLCPEIHGESGLDGTSLPVPTRKPLAEKAIIHIANVVLQHPEQVTIVATGRLTNIAVLLTVFPEVKRNLREIVLMGGAIGLGNTHPAAEFNIQTDPEAARIVFQSGMRVVMVPLEVTHTALVTADILTAVLSIKSNFAQSIAALLVFFRDTYLKVFGFEHPPLHDPCAVAFVINPQMFVTKEMHVSIVTDGICAGRTLCDIHGVLNRPVNACVAMKMDVGQFWEMMLNATRLANEHSPMN
eukprot:TRINITY_DN10280_c0_g1_i1.p1 TRINITY_DN10280_c0_g1~~TRINITY_DN10280_c0_g1_i1.p1  ORF type:complete len:316 (-),score=69.48 TRINITY_DN10280_c0_g1_i1:236-1183(-)